jgi:photosystem II stability/assembly factor-like uncharacterized protein
MNKLYVAFLLVITSLVSFAQKLDMEKLKGMKPRSIGPASMSGRITCIDVVNSNTDVMYVGAASGGVWKTTSAGVTWEPIFDKESVLSIGAITIQQDNPSVIWVGTGEGNPRNSLNGGYGIYKSLDGGKNWKLMGLQKTRNIYRIIIDPKNPNTIYVGAIGSPWGEHPERGVFKSTDGGATWNKILFVDDKTGCADLVMDPTNPNKLIAAMWQHRRWPWTFKSGGPGSGLHITFDGGVTWKKLTDKDGLPEGELGRIGVAISASKPDVIYALIESKKNALYKSTDGGFKWQMINDRPHEIGDRPFYYSDIHVDPLNENRLYTIYSQVNMSIDGGKSFQNLLPYSGVHPDHHAWYIHPTDPSFMVDGNDGGANITRDYGKSWTFMETIPVGQFYHINVDNDFPYNVYGGLQDNYAWVGPAYVWKDDGIRNSYWQAVVSGDGFDIMPDPDDNRFGYAQSQGGELGRYDLKTGFMKTIRPTHPDVKMKLRFNWNSGLAQDPFDNKTIYFGSQFLHKSTDKGSTWEIISGDLTTNDPEKQKQHESGGLTMDATGAENHCSILTISPSKKEKGIIWVGTDDGQVQLTRDGGKTWANVMSKITGFPKGAWVPQINASTYNSGEVFVVVNNYRQFDFKPYLFHSKDFGQTWESMVNESQLGESNYTLSMVQDPIEPKLIFVGTENGLFVSIDEGKTYTKWTNSFPAGVSTMDLIIHPREYDLVIGTFGRAIYVLDDIRPLREMAKKGNQMLDKTIHLFEPPDGYEVTYQMAGGSVYPSHAEFMGENRPNGAMITYTINKPEEKKEDKSTSEKKSDDKKTATKNSKVEVKKEPASDETKTDKPAIKYDSILFEVFNTKGEKIRTIKSKAPDDNGVNRMTWSMTEKGVRGPSRSKAGNFEPSGISILPGTYKVRLTFGKQKDSALINIKQDPRYPNLSAVLESRYKMLKDVEQLRGLAALAMDRLRESKEIAEGYETKIKDLNRDDLKEAKEKNKIIKDSINNIMDYIVGKEDKRQGIVRHADPTPVSYLYRATDYISNSIDPVSETDHRVFKQAEEQITKVVDRVNKFFDKTWSEYRAVMEKVVVSPFKNYEPLKKN